MGLFAEIPMEVYIITAPTAVRDKYGLMEVGSFTEQTEAKVIYIPMGVDTIMELMEAKDIYTQMELDAFAERMVVRGTVTVMEADKLVDIGFTQIYVSKLEDLKTGFLKRENSVSDVVIGGVDTIKCGMMLEYDRKISIQYHTFPGR